MTGALRIGIRLYYHREKAEPKALFYSRRNKENGKRILIVGAGDAGEKCLREILDNPRLSYEVIGFIDDEPGKRGRSLHNVSVLGGVEAIPDVVKEW
ncbi:MAG: hypothetical protein JRJ09_06460 [Deltaproteobacteria bacterium]|nr:hypothetical protein [Deltaproteobacteria bacterium]MBW2111711.1 hypothetical protein [Deltaproteobacteria bacterium]MBW2354309.1 hypothetical protein [Deltaproteobacteria bacterium]